MCDCPLSNLIRLRSCFFYIYLVSLHSMDFNTLLVYMGPADIPALDIYILLYTLPVPVPAVLEFVDTGNSSGHRYTHPRAATDAMSNAAALHSRYYLEGSEAYACMVSARD